MIPINKQIKIAIQGLMGSEQLETMVTTQWQKKAKCLENLTNENKDQLKKIDLKQLKELDYQGNPTEVLWLVLKESKNITQEQKEFAYFLYHNYSKHSLKKQGFD